MTSTASPSIAAPIRTIRIGSRKSQLALVQTYWVRDELKKQFPDLTFEVKTMDTQGDKVLDVSLSKIGDKGLFTQELEDGILQGDLDFAVHSLKDLPTRLPNGLMLGCITEREDRSPHRCLQPNRQDKTSIDCLDSASVGGGETNLNAKSDEDAPLAYSNLGVVT